MFMPALQFMTSTRGCKVAGYFCAIFGLLWWIGAAVTATGTARHAMPASVPLPPLHATAPMAGPLNCARLSAWAESCKACLSTCMKQVGCQRALTARIWSSFMDVLRMSVPNRRQLHAQRWGALHVEAPMVGKDASSSLEACAS